MYMQAIKRAGLTRDEIKPILGVTHVTLRNWDAGKGTMHPAIKGYTDLLIERINSAVSAGDLPIQFPHSRTKDNLDERVKTIKTILKKHK